ncbi:hypothetical protein BJ741DRAFT_615158 [Chytriomyces cf. hyalinus JEL632]|nr:hypothetical protein BJ741DRAFT_615158 [Chytriomyces cf. hyalinus JEL632]
MHSTPQFAHNNRLIMGLSSRPGSISPTKGVYDIMTHRSPSRSSRSSRTNDTPPISPAALDPYTHSDPYDHPTTTYFHHHHHQDLQPPLPRLSISSGIPKMSLECFLQSASSEIDFQSILTMELEEMRTAECLGAVCLYDESGDAVDEVSGFLRPGKMGSMRRESSGMLMSDESLLGDDDSPRTVVMDDDLEAHESIMDPESNSLLMRRESAVGILESMQFSAMDELLRHGDSSKQHVRGVALATVADSKELRLLESFHSKETNIDDVICLLEGKSVPVSSGANVDDEETWMDNVWPSSSVSVAFCVGAVAGMAVSSLLALRRQRRS